MSKFQFNFFSSLIFVLAGFLYFTSQASAATYYYNPSGAGSFPFTRPGINSVYACNLDGRCGWGTFYIDNTAPSCGSVSYGASGVATVKCSDSQSKCTSSSFTKTFSSNGTKSIIIRDNVGYTRACSVNITNIDITPPVCGSVIKTPSGQTNQNVTVSITCSDPGGLGCQQPTYSNVYSSNGSYSLTLVDKGGNTKSCSFSITNIDKSAPSCGSTSVSPSNWTNGNVTGYVQCIGSDCQQSSYSTTFSSNGTQNVIIRDTTGNTRSCSITVSNIDKSPPSCGSINKSPSSWTSGSVWATVSCYDTGGSNCQSSSYGTTFYSNTTQYFTIRDNAGNTRSCGITVSNIDPISPTCSTALSPSVWTNTNVTAVAYCSDSQSGCQQATQSQVVDSNRIVNFTIIDNVNNTSPCNVNVWNIDKIAPTCTTSFLTTINALGWANEDIIAQAQCSDAGGSNCKSNQDLTETIVNHNSNYTFTVKDNAGSANTCTTNTVKIDQDLPACSLAAVGWVTLPESITPSCNDSSVQTVGNGVSGCQTPQSFNITTLGDITNIKVTDNADSDGFCNPDDLMVHHVEIRGIQNTESDSEIKLELTNIVKQNVAGLIRNETPNTNNNSLNYNLRDGSIAYYEGDVSLDGFVVNGKKTIIVKDGDLYLKGNITYGIPNSILGIIVLKDSNGNKGNVFVDNVATDIYTVLLAEGSMFSVSGSTNPIVVSRDNVLINQLYWKGSVITDNTIGGNAASKCPNQGCIYGTSELENDLIYFRSYHYSVSGAQKSSDPQGSGAPMIIEYDAGVQQNTPYGFEVSDEFSFQEIVN